MQNEKDVEDRLRDRGFSIVQPELWSLKDQICLFAEARRVIGPSGSGMFNIVFAEHPERIVDIETYARTVRQHAKLYSSCGADYGFIFAPYQDKEVRDPIMHPYFCPLDLLDAGVEWLLSG
jgi:capsular polysaccharide biosynthesis protein